MNKRYAIEKITQAHEFHEAFLKQSEILVSGVGLYEAQEPVECSECDFGKWLYSEKSSLNQHPWYRDVVRSFEKSHQVYSELYNGVTRKYHPDKNEDLMLCYSQLELQMKILLSNLDDANKHLQAFSEEGSDADDLEEEDIDGAPNTEVLQKGEELPKSTLLDFNFLKFESIDINRQSDQQILASQSFYSLDREVRNRKQISAIKKQELKAEKLCPQDDTLSQSDFDKQKSLKQDINKIHMSLQLRKVDLKNLKKQVKLAKKDIATLEKERNNKEIELGKWSGVLVD